VRIAILSDIHANLAALEAVMAHAEANKVERYISLGDVVGYGPDPVECVDIVAARCDWSLLGNHDCAVLYEPTNFNEVAKRAAYWTRDAIMQRHLVEAAALDAKISSGLLAATDPMVSQERVRIERDRMRRLDFINMMPVRKRFDRYVAVHGTLRKYINEYLFPQDAAQYPRKMRDIFSLIPDGCTLFVGHTHWPGVFSRDYDDFVFESPADLENVWMVPDASEVEAPEELKAIVNPGSVGQPRDGDPRASYAILDTSGPRHKIEFHRVEYDAQKTCDRIFANEQLDRWLGERLLEGR